ncbi:MAG: hypothetical protein QOK00_966 [Thermoleophilaceae bacterium]|nr:hypothetical protein [Thermoleophilaceae bacterium]
MGVLDDAIREHLQLKRSHGAAEEELRRQEDEALGPARREVAPAQPEDGDPTGEQAEAAPPETLPDADAAFDDEVHEHADEAALYEEPAAELEPGPAQVEPQAALEDEPEFDEDDEVQAPAGDTPPRGFQTVVDDDLEEDDEATGDHEPLDEEEDADVLEDTPDFLQETPEHDRLWFEQKPPRDFDFD